MLLFVTGSIEEEFVVVVPAVVYEIDVIQS
jgi:hypothetical protein